MNFYYASSSLTTPLLDKYNDEGLTNCEQMIFEKRQTEIKKREEKKRIKKERRELWKYLRSKEEKRLKKISKFEINLIEKIERGDKVDWYKISQNNELSENFIRRYRDKVCWYDVKHGNRQQELSEDFIKEFGYIFAKIK